MIYSSSLLNTRYTNVISRLSSLLGRETAQLPSALRGLCYVVHCTRFSLLGDVCVRATLLLNYYNFLC